MRGEPKHLNSKADYVYLKEHYPAEVWTPAWQRLLDDRRQWFNNGELAEGQAGVVDDTHSVVEGPAMGGGGLARYQFELREHEDAAIFVLGFTVAEVEAALAEVRQ